jgi:hypothetical protein
MLSTPSVLHELDDVSSQAVPHHLNIGCITL